jgi:hypothetical protein
MNRPNPSANRSFFKPEPFFNPKAARNQDTDAG